MRQWQEETCLVSVAVSKEEGTVTGIVLDRTGLITGAGAPAQPLPADTSDRAIQMLALLQREGRLIDFVLEDLAAYSDAQIGAAARDVHAGCHRVLERYVTLEAILPGREGEAVTIGQDQQVDPAGDSRRPESLW